jgi:expansin
LIKGRRWVTLLQDPRLRALQDPRFRAVVTDRRWITGGLISVTTALVLLGLLFVTQPRGSDRAQTPTTLFLAASPESVIPAADPTKPAAKAKAKPKAVAAKAKPEPKAKPTAKKSAPAKKPASGAQGTGRIQFGKTYTGAGTFYAANGEGNCSFEKTGDLMVGAMNQVDYENSQACGAHLAVTGPKGTVTIRVVDRCPECPKGAIDLSREAFAKIAPTSAGKVSISWRLLSEPTAKPVSYLYKTGSSRWWCAIQVRSHRNPVRSLQVKDDGEWKSLSRQSYNYFVSADGSGCGSTIRVTDIYGNRLTDGGIDVRPDTIQRGDGQFPSP